jgi:hypothetical protein
MGAHNETSRPTPRIIISVPEPPATPPWAGVYITCWKCLAKWQLDSADQCREIGPNKYEVNCWTTGCNQPNTFEVTPV